MTGSAYDAVPYRGGIVSNAAPDRLAVCSLWHGGPRLAPPPHRVAELGCGDGANLLALAFYRPASTFIGIDNAAGELARANARARRLGLDNVQFRQLDIRDLQPGDLGVCDVVVAHGVYSWVPDDARDAIWRVVSDALSPSGLAYVSYNAEPGWRTRRLVRESLLRARRVQEAAPVDQAEVAIALAAEWLGDLPSQDSAHAALLRDELERVRHGNPFYVFHEHLAETNDGFWLGDVVARARHHGLDYVADAQTGTWEGYVPAPMRAALAERDLEPVEQEEAADLLCGRSFHASLFCRSDAPRTALAPVDVLAECWVASSLGATSDALDLTDGVSESFEGTGGDPPPTLSLEDSITKAAAVELSKPWPRGLSLETLTGRAATLLTSHGYPVPPDASLRLSDDLATLYEAGQVELRRTEPAYTPDPPSPCAHALAREEAERGRALTTPYHLSLPVGPETLAVVRALDGSHLRDVLETRFGAMHLDSIVSSLGRWGLLE